MRPLMAGYASNNRKSNFNEDENVLKSLAIQGSFSKFREF